MSDDTGIQQMKPSLSFVARSLLANDGSDERADLTPGFFAYMPAKMIHDAWTKDEGATFFITVDGPFDINWVK